MRRDVRPSFVVECGSGTTRASGHEPNARFSVPTRAQCACGDIAFNSLQIL